MCDCWWMLFWHKTIYKKRKMQISILTIRCLLFFVTTSRISFLPVKKLHQSLHWPSRRSPHRRNVCPWTLCCVETKWQICWHLIHDTGMLLRVWNKSSKHKFFFLCWDCIEIANKAACTWSFYILSKRPNNLEISGILIWNDTYHPELFMALRRSLAYGPERAAGTEMCQLEITIQILYTDRKRAKLHFHIQFNSKMVA